MKKLSSLVVFLFIFTSSFICADQQKAAGSDAKAQVETSEKAVSGELGQAQPEKAHPDFDWKSTQETSTKADVKKPSTKPKKTSKKASKKAPKKTFPEPQIKPSADVTPTTAEGK